MTLPNFETPTHDDTMLDGEETGQQEKHLKHLQNLHAEQLQFYLETPRGTFNTQTNDLEESGDGNGANLTSPQGGRTPVGMGIYHSHNLSNTTVTSTPGAEINGELDFRYQGLNKMSIDTPNTVVIKHDAHGHTVSMNEIELDQMEKETCTDASNVVVMLLLLLMFMFMFLFLFQQWHNANH